MTDRERADPGIEVIAASKDDKAILANLLELYSHDFSEFIDLPIGGDGRFGYNQLDLYWTDPDRFPFLVYVGGVLGGFVLVMRLPEDAGAGSVWDMAEFFVLRGFRRKGVGALVAAQVFDRFPGSWRVRVMKVNVPACAFWSRAVRAYAGTAFDLRAVTAQGREWCVFSFHSPPRGNDGGAGPPQAVTPRP